MERRRMRRGAAAGDRGLGRVRRTLGNPLRCPVRALMHLELGERVDVDAAGPCHLVALALLRRFP